MSKDNLALIIGSIITGLWLYTAIYGSFTRDYQPLQLVTPVMLIVAGYLFGVEIVRRRKNGDND